MSNTPAAPVNTTVLARRQAFGRRLLALRMKADLSQAQLAQAAGLNRAFYVGVEGGKRNVSLDKVFTLADALHVDVAELFHHSDDQTETPSPR
ncbi:helix-turn-helix domain-containing protein [Streptomyces sp. 5K101]|uniref:helix-turn-helix domain-containing protein n=1 Tax=Streptomyces sp. 5K101 TaxID=3390037 RepID=UPI003974B864